MTDPQVHDTSRAHGDGWAGYAKALGVLHSARDAAYQAHLTAQRAKAEREAEASHLTARLGEQQRALVGLATQLKAQLSAPDLAPSAVPPLDGPAALADLRARVDAADAALVEARRVARLPQLLPEWDSRFARAAVVYAGFGIPSFMLTILLSMIGVHENTAVLIWFAVIWPLVTAFGGGAVVVQVTRPRQATEKPGDATDPDDRELQSIALPMLAVRERVYRWFGLLVAWASWLVPGAILDWFAGLWHG
jgi:hypothetical protein